MAVNTATYTGELGVIKYDVSGTPTAVAEVRSFTVDQEQATVETTKMGDTTRTYLPSLAQFSGSMDVFYRDNDNGANALFAGIGASAATVEIYPSGVTTGIKLSGEIIITGHSISSNFDGMVEASISFQGSGALTKTDL